MRRPKIVIFEGPDGAGKSTAANLRAQDEQAHWNPAIVVHNGPPAKGITSRQLFREYMDQLEIAVLNLDEGVSTIIDRSFVSEVVYGPIYRGKSLLTPRQVRRLERFCTKYRIERVGIDTELYRRLARLEARGETFDPNQGLVGARYHTYFRDNKSWTIVSGQLTHTE